jgi:TonB-like protein
VPSKIAPLALLLAIIGASAAFAQTNPNSTKEDVVVVSFFNPRYPVLARTANISGDVELKLEIRKDGSVQSAVAVSGSPLLAPAAFESAQQSRFECRGCQDEITPYSLTYSFQLAAGPDFPCPAEKGPHVTRFQNHVTIAAEPRMVHILFSSYLVRSPKCLYLWACGQRWGGEDFYFYRARSVKCLGLWNCGRRLREPFATCQRLHRTID